MNILLIGPQGSGKGTQADLLAPKFNLIKIATGDLFRSAMASGSQLGESVRRYYDQGELVPDDVTLSVVAERLDSIGEDGVAGAIFDGFPRNLAQAAGLDEALASRTLRVDHVIELVVPEDVLVNRLSGRRVCSKCGAVYHTEFQPPRSENVCDVCGGELIQRADDTPDAIQRRLKLYSEQTAPLLDYYRPRGVLQQIDGNRPIEEVQRDLEAAVVEPANA